MISSNYLCGCNSSSSSHKLLSSIDDTTTSTEDTSNYYNSDSILGAPLHSQPTPSSNQHSITISSVNEDTPTNNMDEHTAAKLYDQAMQGGRNNNDDRFPDIETPLSNDTTMIASNMTSTSPSSNSNSSTPEQNQRERTLTDDTNTSQESVSKHTLVKLMREQVDLVRTLTNTQVAQKKELERIKKENTKLEEENKKKAPSPPPQTPPASSSSRLQLPSHVQRGESTDDNRSVLSKGLDYFTNKSPGNNTKKSRHRSSRHPDAKYHTTSSNRLRSYTGESASPGNYLDEHTITNNNPSMASTIMPSAIVIDSNKANSTGAFGNDMYGPTYTGPGAEQNGYSADRIEITHIPERNVLKNENETSCTSKMWWLFSRLCTLLIPDFLLCCIGRHARVTKGMSAEAKKSARVARKEAKQAWREKVAIFMIMMFCSACFIGVSGVIPMFLCRETTVFTMDEIKARDRAEDWTVIFGSIYDIKDYVDLHPGDSIKQFISKDASKVFPRRPPGLLPDKCVNREKELSRKPVCDEFDEVDQLVGLHCHSSVGFRGINKNMGEYERGVLAHRPQNLNNDPHTEWLMIYNRIYNVTRYVDSLKDETSGKIDLDSEKAYLSDDLNGLIINRRGQDATQVYEALYDDDLALSCLDDLFYAGVLDEPDNILCQALNIIMYSVMIIIAAVLAIQCICSLLYIVRMKRTIKREDTRSKIIVMVPCYNEGDKELRKTIDSVMDTTYPDDNKVLLVIADGNITGKGERMSTPETLAKLLGYNVSPNDKLYKCKSIGELTDNRAKLYYGIHKDAGKELKYLVIVKCGTASERGSPRAGNRGKRDSQLLFTGLLNRFHHGRDLNSLDTAIKNALEHMQLPLDEVRYMMAIDADTRVDRDSISHMAYSMNKNDHILALCGETKVDNKSQSWVTMIQVFEYYTNHHMKKAFESVFGCVTCLPGCFTMYRLFSDDGRPLLSCDDVYQRYATNNVKTLHDKNLYHLGEDRMLTTLLLRYFPDMKLSFVPEASCYTIVPHTFSVLLSQRRRWINSTFHNMLELVRVNTMCGVCCLSMKSIVILDLIATLILPASLIYVGYIVYITVWMKEPLSLLMLVIWGIVIGVQVVVFLLRSRLEYWWWWLIFMIAGVPVFYFILPLYSFWHMDDFSWGTTRQVSSNLKSAKSKDETVSSDRESPKLGFEVVDSQIFDADEHERNARRSRKVSKSGNKSDGLRLKPKLHSSVPVDLDVISVDESDTSNTLYDPNKYKDANEAKNTRRMRRGEC